MDKCRFFYLLCLALKCAFLSEAIDFCGEENPQPPALLRVSAHVSTYLWPEHLHRWFLLISLLWCSVQPPRINKMETYDLICYLSLIKYSSLWLLWSPFLSLLTIIKVILLFSPPSPAPALISFIKSAVLHRDEGVYPPSSRRGRVFVSNWFYSNQQLKIVSSSLHSERISSEKSKHFIQTNHDSLVFLYSRRSRRLSAGCEGLPEEVLAAGFPLSGGEQRAAAGGALQVDADVFGFTVGQREVLLFQSLVLHLQEVREEQLRQRGPRHVLKTRQDKKHTITQCGNVRSSTKLSVGCLKWNEFPVFTLWGRQEGSFAWSLSPTV